MYPEYWMEMKNVLSLKCCYNNELYTLHKSWSMYSIGVQRYSVNDKLLSVVEPQSAVLVDRKDLPTSPRSSAARAHSWRLSTSPEIDGRYSCSGCSAHGSISTQPNPLHAYIMEFKAKVWRYIRCTCRQMDTMSANLERVRGLTVPRIVGSTICSSNSMSWSLGVAHFTTHLSSIALELHSHNSTQGNNLSNKFSHIHLSNKVVWTYYPHPSNGLLPVRSSNIKTPKAYTSILHLSRSGCPYSTVLYLLESSIMLRNA